MRQNFHSRLSLCATLSALLLTTPALAQSGEDDAWNAFDAADVAFQSAQSACEEADTATTGGDRTCRNAIDAGLELVAAVEVVLETMTDLDDDTRESAIDLLLTTQQIVGTYMVDVGDCDDALEVLTGVVEHPLLGNRRSLENAASRWQRNAEECAEDTEPVVAEEADETDVSPAVAPTNGEPGTGSGPATAGYVLTGLGAAMVAGAAVWELALSGDRSDFIDARDLCESGHPSCDPGRTEALGNTIDDAKVPTAILYGLGGASVVTGIILIATGNNRDESDSATLRPMLTRGGAGLTLSTRF